MEEKLIDFRVEQSAEMKGVLKWLQKNKPSLGTVEKKM
jgi:hypothetical protein